MALMVFLEERSPNEDEKNKGITHIAYAAAGSLSQPRWDI